MKFKRTPLSPSWVIFTALLLSCFLLTPSLADGSSSILPSNANDESPNDFLPTASPSEPPSSRMVDHNDTSLIEADDENTSNNNNNNTSKFFSPKADEEEDDINQEYQISPTNKLIGFVFGASVIVSILLLIRNNREHTRQLATLRQQQQERRQREDSRREGNLRDNRKKEFHRRFHFTVIHPHAVVVAAAPEAPVAAEDENENEKQQETHEGIILDDSPNGNENVENGNLDVEAQPQQQSLEDDTDKNNDKDQEDDPAKYQPCAERRPSTNAASNFFANFWKHHKKTHEQECSICLGDYTPGDTICVARAPSKCNHVFHQDCIAEWLKNHNECPLCRVNLMTSD